MKLGVLRALVQSHFLSPWLSRWEVYTARGRVETTHGKPTWIHSKKERLRVFLLFSHGSLSVVCVVVTRPESQGAFVLAVCSSVVSGCASVPPDLGRISWPLSVGTNLGHSPGAPPAQSPRTGLARERLVLKWDHGHSLCWVPAVRLFHWFLVFGFGRSSPLIN